MKKPTILRILELSLFVIAISGCLLATEQPGFQDIPEDAPMNEFILGCWASIYAYDFEGQESVYKFELRVIDEDTLDFVWLNSKGFFAGNSISEYWFIDANEIFIDDKRNFGEEFWLLERDGQDLIVYRTMDNRTDTIIFAREACR